MPRGTYLTEEEKGKILAFRECDVGVREIARRLARSHHVVGNFLKNPEAYGINKKGGPKKKLSERTQRKIVQTASNSLKSVNQIKAELSLDVSRSTIYRTLKSSPYIQRQKLKQAPRLLPRHKQARLQFARSNMRRDWSKVIFSDEKKFNLDGPDGIFSYWRDLRKEQRYFSSRNFGGGSLMVWGAFCQTGTVQIAFPSTRMNSEEYIELLQIHLLPFLRRNRRVGYTFQQDNASVHQSRATMAWFNKQRVQTMEWPACSPDQNPIENMWGLIVRKVYADNKQYASVQDLKQAVLSAWNSIQVSTCRNLIESMPNRLFELIENKGGPTHY